jgi:hypothetical protein
VRKPGDCGSGTVLGRAMTSSSMLQSALECPEGTLAACVKLEVVTQLRAKSSTNSTPSRKTTASHGIRAATSKVKAKTSINFPRSVRGK